MDKHTRDSSISLLLRIRNYRLAEHYIDGNILDIIYRLNNLTLDILGISSSENIHLADRVCGRFCLFRKSVENEAFVLLSKIIVEHHVPNNTIVVLHIAIDQDETQKISFGFAYAKRGSIFFSLFLEDKSAVEFIVINRPQAGRLNSSFGFIETPDSLTRIVPVSARIYLMRQSDETDKFEDRIDLSDKNYDTTTNPIKKILDAIDKDAARRIKS